MNHKSPFLCFNSFNWNILQLLLTPRFCFTSFFFIEEKRCFSRISNNLFRQRKRISRQCLLFSHRLKFSQHQQHASKFLQGTNAKFTLSCKNCFSAVFSRERRKRVVPDSWFERIQIVFLYEDLILFFCFRERSLDLFCVSVFEGRLPDLLKKKSYFIFFESIRYIRPLGRRWQLSKVLS